MPESTNQHSEQPQVQIDDGYRLPDSSRYRSALGVSQTASWGEIESKYSEFKAGYQGKLIADLGASQSAMSLHEETKDDFSSKYWAYDALKKEELIKNLLDNADTIPKVINALSQLIQEGIPFIDTESGTRVSVAGAQKYIQQAKRLATSFPREDVDATVLDMIPVQFGLKEFVKDEVKEVQSVLLELETTRDLVRVRELLNKLLFKGYRLLPRIIFSDRKLYRVSLRDEMAIVNRQLRQEQEYRNRPVMLSRIRQQEPQYVFGQTSSSEEPKPNN